VLTSHTTEDLREAMFAILATFEATPGAYILPPRSTRDHVSDSGYLCGNAGCLLFKPLKTMFAIPATIAATPGAYMKICHPQFGGVFVKAITLQDF
jgi:hypothetical protein